MRERELKGEARKLNAETQSAQSAQREEKSVAGEGDRVRAEPNIKYYTTDSYHMSIVVLFTCMSFERGLAEVERFEGVASD
jgi:hypothetical protein